MDADILIVDDDAEMAAMVARYLQHQGFRAAAATGGAEAVTLLDRQHFDVVVTDLVMEGVDGLAVLRHVKRARPEADVILITAFGTLESAVTALREGAHDYLTKPFKLGDVAAAVRRALDRRRRGPRGAVDHPSAAPEGLEALIGDSPAMRTLKAQIVAIADSDAAVLLLGESGTGKELAARAIHAASRRGHGPFVAVNCAAIPETLLESELFGYEKGAFTGASQRRRGLFAEAETGTLLLDEIGDMPLGLQSKLLRVLQERKLRRVGGGEEIPVDLRVITATNQDLATLVDQKHFRADLYYRLAVIPLQLPTLRERTEDIPALAQHFLTRFAARLGKDVRSLSPDAIAWLKQQRWPGNVRQLENVVERAVTLATGDVLALPDLTSPLPAPRVASDSGPTPTLAELEDDYIRRVLAQVNGNKRAAARILGLSVRTLQRRTPSRRDTVA
ncbi:MAG TPA: sigma-54 dependent transcriptional regulator [Methylomirabilota bacterium]|nr:sigma-54 dependent transcriptional regulator [Methylomirabilota bacterium]